MSFTLKYFGKEKSFNSKVQLLDLLEKNDKSYICARVNNRVRELTYEVYYDANVEFLTVKDSDAIHTYESSLRFVLAMAINRVDPELEVRFCYNVSRSIFVQILNKEKNASPEFVEKVDAEMKRIIAADYPLERGVYSKEDAAKIYKEHHLDDKLAILQYRPEKTVHLYNCDGYMNYMFARMVPSTGYLKSYKLRHYAPGMIVQ